MKREKYAQKVRGKKKVVSRRPGKKKKKNSGTTGSLRVSALFSIIFTINF